MCRFRFSTDWFCNSSNVEELAHVMILSRARKKISMRTQSMNPKSLACVEISLVVVLVKFHNFTHSESEKSRLKPTSEKKKSSLYPYAREGRRKIAHELCLQVHSYGPKPHWQILVNFSIQREDVIPKYSLISHPTADRIFVYLKAADQYSTTSSPLRNGRVLKQPFWLPFWYIPSFSASCECFWKCGN